MCNVIFVFDKIKSLMLIYTLNQNWVILQQKKIWEQLLWGSKTEIYDKDWLKWEKNAHPIIILNIVKHIT